MSYLVLGSNSFAGAVFIDYLLGNGEKVTGISRSPELPPVMQPYLNNPYKEAFSFYQIDINLHHEELRNIILKLKPTHIVDFAGQGMVAESWQNPAQWYQTNILAKIKLHQFLKDCDFIERYVRVSTPEVYGHTQKKVNENHPYLPSTPYAVSHAAIDMSLIAFYRQYKFPVILTRFANFYGPYQQLYRIVPRTILYGLIGKTLPLHGGGVSQRMFIYGEDIASGIYQASIKGIPGETYHFATGPCLSICNLVKKICRKMGVKMESFVEVAEDRAGKDARYVMDTRKAQSELGWNSKISLEEGLDRTAYWVKKNLTDLQTLPMQYIHKP